MNVHVGPVEPILWLSIAGTLVGLGLIAHAMWRNRK